MNIAILLPSLERKGPILVANDLAFELLKNPDINSVNVFYFDECDLPIIFPCETIKIKFNQTIDFGKFDIIHSHTLRTDIYLFINKKSAKKNNCKIVTTIHQYNYESFLYSYKNKIISKILCFIWNLILIRHDEIFVLSNDMKKYYLKTLFNKKIQFVHNGRPIPNKSSLQDIPHLTKIKKNFSIIGTACSLTSRKGIEQVIKALPSLNSFYFVIIGDGPELNSLQKLAEDLNVTERCIFEGFKNNYLDYYKYFDVFILPSRSEGFGLSLIEAASMSLPIVCSNIPSFNEIFNNNEVLFFEIDNIESIINSINNAIINKNSLSLNSNKRYLLQYTSKVMAHNYLSLYKKLL